MLTCLQKMCSIGGIEREGRAMNDSDQRWFAMMLEHVVSSLAGIENSLLVLVDHFVDDDEDDNNE